MRKLMWFTLGFSASIALSAYLPIGIWYLLLLPVLLAAVIVLFLLKKTACRVAAGILIGSIAGFLYYAGFHSLVLSQIKACDGTEQHLTVEATDYAFQTGYGYAVDGSVQINGKSCSVRVYYSAEAAAQPGDELSGRMRLRYTPGGLENATYHKGEGIFLLAYGEEEIQVIPAASVPAKYFAAQLRKNISQRISAIFPQDTAAFAKALLLGDDSQIDFRDNIAFQKSGIRHVIAVSGLHISILFGFVYFITVRRTWLTTLVGLPVLLLFCAVAGFTPSIVRACIMQALMLLSMLVRREYDRGTSLAFAALVILLINPLAITSVSFQLSVGSMIGIFLFSQRISRYVLSRKPFQKWNPKRRMGRFFQWLVKSVSVTIGALLVTMPLCALYFGMVSVISIVTNLMTLWIVSTVFYGIIVACILSCLWMPAGTAVAYCISWLIRYILWISRLLSHTPGGVAYTDSPYTVVWVISTLSFVAIFFLCKRKSPVLLAAAISAFYVLSLFTTWLEPQLDNVRITVLDVGQGQCVLLQSKNSAYLLDCGGEHPEQVAEKAVRTIGAQGIHKLDGIILTHFDKDHANGTKYLLQAVPVDRLYLPDTEEDNAIRAELEAQPVPITWVRETQLLSCGTGALTMYPSDSGNGGNESSMCILYQRENCAILVTGDRDFDGEHSLLEQGNIPKLDVLVAGHHGAYSSAGWELLSRTQPDIAVISVGENNFHKHPDAYTLDRLYRFGCIVRRTDQEGTITIRG